MTNEPAAQRRHEAMDRIAGRLADIEHNLTSGHDEHCWTDRRDLAAFTREMLEVCLGAQARERGEVAVRVVLGAACHLGSRFDIDADLAQTEPQQSATEHSGGPCCIGNVSPKGEYVAIETEHGEALYSHRDAVHAAEQLLAAAHTVTGEPQQPATAAHSDAQGQREQLRERIAFVLHDTDCSGCAEDPTVVDRYYRLADAVLPILDELRQRAETAEAGLVESNWPDGGPGDDPPEVTLAKMRQRAEKAEAERDDEVLAKQAVMERVEDQEVALTRRAEKAEAEQQRAEELLAEADRAAASQRQRLQAAEQERDALREHVEADHQLLKRIRRLVWNVDDGTTNPAVPCSQLLRVLNGDADG